MEAPLRCAEGHVQDGPVFGDVDLLAAEHGVDPLAQTGFLGQLHEQLKRFVGDTVLGVIQVEPHRLGGQPLAAPGVVRKERAKMHLADLLVMSCQGLPCTAFGERQDLSCRICHDECLLLGLSSVRRLHLRIGAHR